jgi:hypothetical protein
MTSEKSAGPYPWSDSRPRIYGWKAIAAELNMSKTAAWRYADTEVWTFPLPAYLSPMGWFAYADELSFWFTRFKLPRGTEHALMRRAKPANMARRRAKAKKRRATKAAT